ncbi:hypothetical protein PHLCEN_2v4266 [Hermanssonia centrifuga]|uniref:Uncharacterized protein n=1 Tax=Hermanssonia centrifuga TaxID=98765 RepID=A0A2R6PVI4_9APHY|nr:hypothetical protein PHLCEN_2v4266 [Hermanssonia centrifuga]
MPQDMRPMPANAEAKFKEFRAVGRRIMNQIEPTGAPPKFSIFAKDDEDMYSPKHAFKWSNAVTWMNAKPSKIVDGNNLPPFEAHIRSRSTTNEFGIRPVSVNK